MTKNITKLKPEEVQLFGDFMFNDMKLKIIEIHSNNVFKADFKNENHDISEEVFVEYIPSTGVWFAY